MAAGEKEQKENSQINLYVNTALWQEFRHFCLDRKRSASQIVSELMRNKIEESKKENEKN